MYKKQSLRGKRELISDKLQRVAVMNTTQKNIILTTRSGMMRARSVFGKMKE